MTTNANALSTMVTSTIVEYYNEYAAQPVKKFQDKETAVRRTAALLDEKGLVFDANCQLVEVAAAQPVAEPEPVADELSDKEQEIVASYNEAKPKPKARAKSEKQPSLKGRRISVIGGKDAANPYREGSKSHATFAMVQANPGKTYDELRDMGARMRTITHSTKTGTMRTV